MRPFQAESVNEASKTPGVVGHTESLRRIRRLAAARGIPGDHLEFVRETLKLWAPHSRVAKESMQENKRLTLAAALICDPEPVDLDMLHALLDRNRWPGNRPSGPAGGRSAGLELVTSWR